MIKNRSVLRRAALVAATVTAAGVLAACGSDGMSGMDHGAGADPSVSASASASARAHNAADVDFAKEMITHHRQAIEMADLAATRASSTDVKALAEKIKSAQDPEINTMSGWLTSWGEGVPADMTGMGHDMSASMPGMMSADDMADLDRAKGAEFDTTFLEMMVDHHQGAIEMATTEKSKGQYGPATELAASVITAQSAEIKQMHDLLGKS
ncbi:DUF305 domain-containing protein [Actinacidiphila glaucinigra]|uniref:DUF305 domain-containing protein n=1 Tax=Actinacidiphila glaucinigra TaxID=235986 RepID=UPI002E3059A6|nr:DUF305 domain-containing protein [Actinacidiphila glaucinigra]